MGEYGPFPSLFEVDERKSRINKLKHGIDFVEAQALWRDEALAEVQTRSGIEPRFVMVGRIGDTHWSAVVTYRGETVRLISVRRSRRREVQAYEGQ